jgi:hypothetical protein
MDIARRPHAGLRHPHFLEYLGVVPIQPLGRRLAARGEVPPVMGIRLADPRQMLRA